MSESRKPKPKHVTTVCDVCGLGWARHGKAPTTDKCIELLKADLASEKMRVAPRPQLPQPYPVVPYPVAPVPYPRPFRPPWYQPTWIGSGTAATPKPYTQTINAAGGNYSNVTQSH